MIANFCLTAKSWKRLIFDCFLTVLMQEMTEPIEARVRKLQRRGAVWRPPLLFDVRSFLGAALEPILSSSRSGTDADFSHKSNPDPNPDLYLNSKPMCRSSGCPVSMQRRTPTKVHAGGLTAPPASADPAGTAVLLQRPRGAVRRDHGRRPAGDLPGRRGHLDTHQREGESGCSVRSSDTVAAVVVQTPV